MRLGIVVPNQISAASPKAITSVSLAAEAAGFDSLWVADHIAIPTEFESRYPLEPAEQFIPAEQETYYEPCLSLAHVAAITTTIRLGTSVLIPALRHPTYTAKLVATLDQLSGGRVVLGVGAGWLAEEFEILGIDNFRSRGSMLAEHCRVIRALWAEEEAGWSGQFYAFPPIRSRPKPMQQGGPPIWMGGASRAALKRAVAVADGWQPIGLGPTDLAMARNDLHEELRKAKRDPATFDIAARCRVGLHARPSDAPDSAIFGSPDEVVEGLKAYAAAGCSELIFDVSPTEPGARVAAIQELGEKVVPCLK